MRALALALILATPAMAADDDHSDHLSSLDGLRVLHAWTNETSDEHAMVYLEIENQRDRDVTLVGAETAIAAEVQVVATDPGTGAHVPLAEIVIPAGAEMELTPDGIFLELHDLSKPLDHGGAFEIELEFKDGAHVEVHVEVEDADATAHGHAGHSH